MIKSVEIEFVRSALERTFDNSQYKMVSFYEPLKELKEIEEYKKLYIDVINDLNNASYKVIGVVSTTNSPTITSVVNSFISPFEYSVALRCKVKYRDEVISKTYEMIDKRKGRKIEIAQLTKNGESTELVPMEVLFQNSSAIKDYDFIGETNDVEDTISNLINKGMIFDTSKTYLLYGIEENTNKLCLYKIVYDDEIWKMSSIEKEYDNDNYELYKLDLSFDSLTISTPQTLNGEDFMTISFSGSATLCSKNVALGNDLVKVGIKKYKVANVIQEDEEYEYIDPLDIPNDYKPDIFSYGLASNGFKGSEHIQSYSSNISYTFIVENTTNFVWNLYIDTRYLRSENPNTIYKICEIYSSLGEIRIEEYLGKLTNGVKTSKNDNDVMSIDVSFAVVGENE